MITNSHHHCTHSKREMLLHPHLIKELLLNKRGTRTDSSLYSSTHPRTTSHGSSGCTCISDRGSEVTLWALQILAQWLLHVFLHPLPLWGSWCPGHQNFCHSTCACAPDPGSMAVPHESMPDASKSWLVQASQCPRPYSFSQCMSTHVPNSGSTTGNCTSDIYATTSGCLQPEHSGNRDPFGCIFAHRRKRDQVVPSSLCTANLKSTLQTPAAFAIDDPCNLCHCWSQLTELHGDYAAGPSPELNLPHPNQLALWCPPVAKVYRHQYQSLLSGQGHCSIKCSQINTRLTKKKMEDSNCQNHEWKRVDC